jgi:hypothetical protein
MDGVMREQLVLSEDGLVHVRVALNKSHSINPLCVRLLLARSAGAGDCVLNLRLATSAPGR